MDCSAGFDNIPVSFIKPVIDVITSPLAHIINACIDKDVFPPLWKIGKISPIPKSTTSLLPDDYRPVSVLPLLSKIFERLIAIQMRLY